ncbi:hypothetical protein VTN77DRAFT_2838 [Rasamsonia byssochlamydoides]|uniref:uncharacterized protein n=1 Tax=Rasamsonia byssochlamydoides TaxID=89139 RepID=UPI00374409ED
MNPLGYQPISSQPAHVSSQPAVGSTQTGAPASVQAQASHALGNLPNTRDASSDEMDREEGEVSEKNGDSYSGQYDGQNFSRSPVPHVTEYEGTYGADRTSRDLNGLETGRDSSKSHPSSTSQPYETSRRHSTGMADVGASSDTSQSRRDASESPYNPPMSIEPLDDHVQRTSDKASQQAAESQTGSNSVDNKDGRPSYLAGKTPAQMRVLAQGALLGLAPHNIRYKELVAEDISPTILRQLYEEIGIKVSPTDSKATTEVVTSSTAAPSQAANGDSGPGNGQVDPVKSQKETVSPAQPPQTQNATSTTTTTKAPEVTGKEAVPGLARGPDAQTDTTKPLERKEVIARMLAAKANKTSNPPSTAKTEHPSIAANKVAEAPARTAPSAETQVKEKNKAQTELARQRMEQLKRQGLPKSQQRPQAEVASQSASHQGPSHGQVSHSSGQASVTLTLQHPLPERPPDPQPAPTAVPTARIPGLFMTHSEPSDAAKSRPQGTVADSVSTEAKTMPRKRPRASDFDEPVATSKKPLLPEDRLVIDISEDESMHGEDEEGSKTVAETTSGNVASSQAATPRPLPPTDFSQRKVTGPLQQRSSVSQTPPRLADQESLRLKDLEIQAMRRRIAEYEQRKKAKLAASRTQSPGSSNAPSATSLPGNNAEAQPVSKEAPAAPVTNAETQLANQRTVPKDSRPSSLHRSPSVQSLASMDSAQLEIIRQKILRKQEIESGLPALDAELSKSEAKLAECKREEERLLAEIAKGREGKKQLIDELESLGAETEGLTLEALQAAKNEAEQRERSEAARVSASDQPEGLPESSDAPVTDKPISKPTADEEPPATVSPQGLDSEQQPSSDTVAVAEMPQGALNASAVTPSNEDDMRVAVERENTGSVSSGSSMDESISSAQSTSVDQPPQSDSGVLSHTTVPEAPAVCETEISTESRLPAKEAEYTSQPGCLPGLEAPAPTADTVADNAKSCPSENVNPSREPSVASDVYEPPEPEYTPDSAASAYTPPFSPSPPDHVEAETVPVPPSSLPEADEALTKNVQESTGAYEPGFGILGDERRGDNLVSRFSPYISPLRYFKSYRYHPKFTEEVPGGYRSLTYSHNIDPMKSLCPYEAAGGVCNDNTCEFQHWRQMVLTDDKILVQMGSLREGKTPEERDKYIEGLKQIINDMRRDKVKDFNTVATEIAAYRRRFLQDPSRVVPL